ncbi:MAG: hypothetical protein CM1200mP1_05220 [Candidatus Neomarinimicrobiota bacterium]|nr:MAG: hypothetical protein CM1200mP1_05220 [Candidatus Neomarinimicrobiota bacterium]
MRDINIKFFIGLSLLLVIIRLLFISNTLLINDEAYYAIYARHLAWGYVDHGPKIAYLINFLLLFGRTALQFVGGHNTNVSSKIILYYFGKKYFNSQTGVLLSLSLTAKCFFIQIQL